MYTCNNTVYTISCNMFVMSEWVCVSVWEKKCNQINRKKAVFLSWSPLWREGGGGGVSRGYFSYHVFIWIKHKEKTSIFTIYATLFLIDFGETLCLHYSFSSWIRTLAKDHPIPLILWPLSPPQFCSLVAEVLNDDMFCCCNAESEIPTLDTFKRNLKTHLFQQ